MALLRVHRRFSVSFSLWLLLCSIVYGYTSPAASCVSACQEAAGYVLWKDTDPEATYYENACGPGLQVRSTFLCARYYCTPSQIEVGLEDLNEETCMRYGNLPLEPFSIVDNVSEQELQNLPRSTYADIAAKTVFNKSTIPNREFFAISHKTLQQWIYEYNTHEIYGWAMYAFWVGVVLLSLTTKLISYTLRKTGSRSPNGTDGSSEGKGVFSSFISYLTTSATFGGRCAEPYGWCTVPPLLQTLTIVAFVVINIVLCAVSYVSFNGNLYWASRTVQIWRYIADRTGIISFANLPLLWIFGTRNNILLWVTGWNFATFNAFHRWVARVATVEAILHSVAWTVEFLLDSAEYFYSEWKARYFWNGVIATFTMSILLGVSLYGIRYRAYEIFLLLHISLALVTLVTLFYHVRIFNGVYDGYLWACVAIWAFDRLARIVRIVALNFKFFTRSEYAVASYSSDSNVISLRVPTSLHLKPRPGTMYFVYLLHGWKFWESHPFTATWPGLEPWKGTVEAKSVDGSPSPNHEDEIKSPVSSTDSSENNASEADLTHVRFCIRPYGSFTARLRDKLAQSAGSERRLRVLIEGPYGSVESIRHYRNNLLVIGGSGITAALSHLQSTLAARPPRTPTMFFHWSVRHVEMFEQFRDELESLCRSLGVKITVHVTRDDKTMALTDKHVGAGSWAIRYGRMDLQEVIQKTADEIAGSLAVMSCGPAGMMDEARAAVVRLTGRSGKDVTYYQESFGW